MMLFDFSNIAAVGGWLAIDDRVMGGVSRSRLRHDPAGHAVFEGLVCLERNAGFASVRSGIGVFGTPDADCCEIEVRGEERRYKLSLMTDDRFDTINYQAEFAPIGQKWTVVRLPISTFRATFRGREVPGTPPLNPARIRQIGLMIAGQQAGSFALDVRRIWLS